MKSLHSRRLPMMGLPLLTRELIEMANRWRTYVLRVVYAVILFTVAYFQFYDILQPSSDPFALLGHGRRMFDALATLEFAGIFLFMPILACNTITLEKEKNTLPLLLLTRLGPMTIVLEKLLSRLVPMFMFLLLAMPLLGFTYSLGGVTEVRLWGTVVVLGLTALMVGSMTVMCSACYATTFSALIASYVCAFGGMTLFFCCGVATVFDNPGGVSDGFGAYIVWSTLLIVATCICVSLARTYVVTRASQPRDHALERALNHPGRLEVQVTKSGGRMVVMRPGRRLPADQPVAWRELTRSSTAILAQLIVIMEISLSLLLIPALLSLVADVGTGQLGSFFTVIEALLWLIVIVLLVVTGSGAMSRERDRQTMEVLLTTPLTGREIVIQKMQPAWRLVVLSWIPFGTLFLIRLAFWIKGGVPVIPGFQLLATGIAILIYLPLTVWLTQWISLRIRSQGRTIFLTLGLISIWVVLPLLAPRPLGVSGYSQVAFLSVLTLSPLALFQSSVLHSTGSAMAVMLVVFVVYTTMAALLRRHVLNHADARLGRISEQDKFDSSGVNPIGTVVGRR